MRIGEVIRLDQDDVDFAAGVLVVSESKYGNYAERAIMRSGAALALSRNRDGGDLSA